MRILGDIVNSSCDTGAVFELDQTFLLQKKQRSRFVRRVVGNRDRIAVRHFIERLLCSAVDSERLIVNLAVLGDCKMRAVLLVEGIQIIDMLEIVRVKLAGLYYVVRLHIVLEFLDFEIISLTSEDLFCFCKDFGVRCYACRNRNLFAGTILCRLGSCRSCRHIRFGSCACSRCSGRSRRVSRLRASASRKYTCCQNSCGNYCQNFVVFHNMLLLSYIF